MTLLWRKRTWLAKPEGWLDLVEATSFLAMVVGICVYGERLTGGHSFILWVVLLVAQAFLFRRGWERLLGPVFVFDLVRTSRHGRYVLFRCIFGGLLLFVLFWFYGNWFGGPSVLGSEMFDGVRLPQSQLPAFAQSFFTTFMVVQYVAVLILTPVYVAGAIAEEKDRRTLDLLLTTELSDREIILGKLAPRLANLALLLLTGLPVLCFTFFFGGVQPSFVFLGFAVVGVTMLSLGSLSILVSIQAKNPLQAVTRTYGAVAMYLTFGSLVPVLCLGNPLILLWSFREASDGGKAHGEEALALLVGYALVHLTAAIVFCSRACTLLRLMRSSEYHRVRSTEYHRVFQNALQSARIARESNINRGVTSPADASNPSTKEPAPLQAATEPVDLDFAVPVALDEEEPSPRSARPPIRDDALWWKEIHSGQEFRFDRIAAPFLVLVPIVATFGSIFFLTSWLTALYTGKSGQIMNLWVRVLGTILSCFMYLYIAYVAASKISRERERQTLDSLLTTPLERDDILHAKWLASIYSVRPLAGFLLGIWIIGFAMGGVHLLVLPLLAAAWLIQAALMASLGLYFSVVCRTTLRATLWTIITFLVLGFGPPIMETDWLRSISAYAPRPLLRFVAALQQNGLSPAMTHVVLTSYPGDFLEAKSTSSPENVTVAMFGLVLHAGAAGVLWIAARARFQEEKGPAPQQNARLSAEPSLKVYDSQKSH